MSKPYFVYGTLKPGGRYWPQIAARVAAHEPAEVDGFDLFDLKVGYPAIVEGKGRVKGVLLRFHPAQATEAIATMDRIEGWDPAAAAPLYRPLEVDVTTDDGRVSAITYVWGSGLREDLANRGVYLSHGMWQARGDA